MLVLDPVTGASQERYSVESAIENETIQQGQKKEKGDPSIRLTMNASSISSILIALGKEVKQPVIFNYKDPRFARRINVNIVETDVMRAFSTVLKGTGLTAELAPDGRTIVVRGAEKEPRSDSVKGPVSSVTGVVMDSATKQVLSGVTVTVMGTSLSTVTREDGEFRIAGVPVGNHSLNIKLLGYQTRTLQIAVDSGRATTVAITLHQTTTTLSEVVTTATGQQRRVEISNDIAKINPDVIRQRAPVTNVTDLIEAAQVPGVLVTRSSGDPGSPSRIRIRGLGSISQSNAPMIMVDNVWIDAEEGTARLDALDPEMIESIEIVRGPSAATIYGQSSANGVIVITTKKGAVGPTRWTAVYGYDTGRPYGSKPMVYRGVGHAIRSEQSRLCNIQDVLDRLCEQDSVLAFDPNHPLLDGEGRQSNHRYSLSMDGGTRMVRYNITASAQENIGAREVQGIDLIRYRILDVPVEGKYLKPRIQQLRSIGAMFTVTPDDRWDLQTGITTTQNSIEDNNIGALFVGGGAIPAEFNLDTLNFRNNTFRVSERAAPTRTVNTLMSVQGRWTPHTLWSFRGNGGYEQGTTRQGERRRSLICVPGSACTDSLGEGIQDAIQSSIYTLRFQGNFNPSLGRLSSFVEIRPAFGADYLRNGEWTTGSQAIFNGNTKATAGWWINSTVGLFRRIYFDLGLRQDLGSGAVQSTSNSSSQYPKLGGSWLVSDESFWPLRDYVPVFRVRGALGHAAVQPEVAEIHGGYVTDYEFINGTWIPTINLARLGNPRLKPERAVELEVGFDTDMLSNRLSLGVTYAHKENRNNLIRRRLAPSAGVSTTAAERLENIARVVNRNLELTANARVLDNRLALLVIDYGLTLSENRVARLGDGISPQSAGSDSRIEAGYPIAGVWSQAVLGYTDTNGDGLLSNDEVILSDSSSYIGWSQPRYRASYGVSLSLLNRVTITSNFAYQSRYVQNLAANSGLGTRRGLEDINSPLSVQALERVRQRGMRPVSDLRWSNATVAFNVPASLLTRLRARDLSIRLQGSNLGLWTNYMGRDPGVNTAAISGDQLVDDGIALPRSRSYTLSVRWGF